MKNRLEFPRIAGLLTYVVVLLGISSSAVFAGCIYAVPMSAEEVDMGNLITWSTAYEEATDYFAIFKSHNGIDFEQIGEETAMGISKIKKDYRFLDSSIGENRVFYRLLQVDLDGKQSYTHIVVVQKHKTNNFVVSMMGNTTVDRYFNVVFKSKEEGHMSYRLVNMNEEVVKRGVIAIEEGQNLFTLDLENTTSGRYKFLFTMNKEEEQLVLIKSAEDVLVKQK